MTSGDYTVLGLETSCDETAAAVVRRRADGSIEVLSSVVASQDEHKPFGGVVPEIAARGHVRIIDDIAREALAASGLGFEGIDGVAATAGPGLVGGVMVGLSFGKAVALARNLPLVAVNHLEGHALSARLAPARPRRSGWGPRRSGAAGAPASADPATTPGRRPPARRR